MSNSSAVGRKVRAEVENLIDEVVQTIENGVAHPDGRPGFRRQEAEQLKARLGVFAEEIMKALRGDPGSEIGASIDAAVETIRKGVLHPMEGPGFGAKQAKKLSASLQGFADAIVTAARDGTRAEIDDAVGQVVKTIRSGLFRVYGRASYAAITGDQLDAYLQTFADAVLTVVERDHGSGSGSAAQKRAAPA